MRPRQKLPPLHPGHPVGRSLTYSLLFHIIILLALTFVYLSPTQPPSEIPVIEVTYLPVPAPEAPPSPAEQLEAASSPVGLISSTISDLSIPNTIPIPEPDLAIATPAISPDPAPLPRPATGIGTRLGHWYYTSLATFRHGGTHWQNWEPTIRPVLLESQSANGSWPAALYPVDAVEGGTHLRELTDSTVYRTALCTLMLEVYYRYLKST